MKAHAEFVLDTFDQSPPHDETDGVELSRARIEKTFHGDLEGTSSVEMIAARGQDGGAGYVAVERVVGSLNGKTGSFVLLHAGTMSDGTQWAVWPIVPGSGTGELAGIRGEGRIEIDDKGGHMFTMEYGFD